MRLHRSSAIALTIVAALAAACAGDATTEPKVDVTGTYTLASINGKAMPYKDAYTFFENGVTKSDSTFALDGSITLNANHAFVLAVTFRDKIYAGSTVFVDETYTDHASGSWTLSGTTLTVTDVTDGVSNTVPATLVGNNITIAVADTIRTSATATTIRQVVFVFTKP
ncbi:MAG: hypothetical protein ABIV28_08050 [Longimicrobiales bacterium]